MSILYICIISAKVIIILIQLHQDNTISHIKRKNSRLFTFIVLNKSVLKNSHGLRMAGKRVPVRRIMRG